MKFPYIKPTRYRHSSGFRTFEVGYCDIDDKYNAVDITVLGSTTDHVFQDYMMQTSNQKPWCLNMDLTRNGYIRLYVLGDRRKQLQWKYDSFATSGMELELVDKPS